jgi:tRNA(Ile)-lysidine synthase
MPRLASFEDRVADVLRRIRRVEAPIVVAFSGGTDSLALAILVARARPESQLVHIHHGLHPSADSGAEHAANLAEALGLGLAVRLVDGAAICASKHGVEGAARLARYTALAEAAGPGRKIFTAHTADDRVETFIMRLAQGAGIDGLRGPRRSAVICGAHVRRVMLGLWREDTQRIVGEAGMTPWHDPMNDDTHHLRVRIRGDLAPALRDLLGRNALLRSLEQLDDDAQIVARLTRRLLDAATIAQRPGLFVLDRPTLRTFAPAECRSVLRSAIVAAGARPTRDVIEDTWRRISTAGPATLMAHRLRIEIDRSEVRVAAVSNPREALGSESTMDPAENG